MIELSGSELHAACAKALLGAGAGSALAADGATAALWLHAHDYDGTRAVVELTPTQPTARSLGTAAVDRLIDQATRDQSRASELRIEAADAASPLMLVGLLGVAASRNGARFLIDSDADLRSIAIGTALVVGPVDDLQTPMTIACTVQQHAGQTEASRPARVRVTETQWERVNAAAARTYVASNEHSRATGAGAGLVDTD